MEVAVVMEIPMQGTLDRERGSIFICASIEMPFIMK